MPHRQLTFPFSAIVGQENLKLALILNAIDPRIGGVLISGAKGTGKSLAVRAFTEIIPPVKSVEDCPYSCNPNNLIELCQSCRSKLNLYGSLPTKKRRIELINLPLSVTEDRLVGTLDVETVLKSGKKTLQPGLLAEANQNILYIDEINLLPDYLINCFLDPAASGWNFVQREGISLSHPSRFALIASMNPEEGELRPQILDRFAFHVKTEPINNPQQRIEIAKKNIIFEENPTRFYKEFEKDQEKLKNRIIDAQKLLPNVIIPNHVFKYIAQECAELEVEGCRSDIAAVKAAKALAAFKGKTIVESGDVSEIYDLVLSHRKLKRGYKTFNERFKSGHVKNLSTTEIPEPSKNARASEMLINQTERDIETLFERPTRSTSRRRRKRSNKIFKAIFPLLLFLFIFVTYFAIVGGATYLYYTVAGLPYEGATEIISFGRLWPYLIFLTLATLIFPLILSNLSIGKSKQKTILSPIYLYKAYGGKIRRKIVQQIQPSFIVSDNKPNNQRDEDPEPSTSNILNVPIYASIHRLYKQILNRGAKIAESLKQFKERSKKYKFSLATRIKHRRGSIVGKRIKTMSSSRYGRYISYKFPMKKPWDIAIVPTIRAAVPFQNQRKKSKLAIAIKSEDFRIKMRETRTPLTLLILLDMSESMTTSLDNIRNAILSMYDIAYKKRDRIGLVVFKGSGASVLQPPTTNLNLLEKKILEVGASDFTPLARGMFEAWKVLRNEKMRSKDIIPILIIISDGIANVPLKRPLTPFTRSKFLNIAQADVIDMAGLLYRERIQTIIINTAHEEEPIISSPLEEIAKYSYTQAIAQKVNKQWMNPTKLLLEIPRITGGYYYGIGEGGVIESEILMDAFTIIDREHPSKA